MLIDSSAHHFFDSGVSGTCHVKLTESQWYFLTNWWSNWVRSNSVISIRRGIQALADTRLVTVIVRKVKYRDLHACDYWHQQVNVHESKNDILKLIHSQSENFKWWPPSVILVLFTYPTTNERLSWYLCYGHIIKRLRLLHLRYCSLKIFTS